MSINVFSSASSRNDPTLRAITLYGSPDALPLAILQPSEDTASQQALPEPILWRYPQWLVLFSAFLLAIEAGPLLILAVLGLGAVLIPGVFTPLSSTSDFVILFLVASAIFALALTLAGFLIFRRPSGVSVDNSGLTSHRIIGAKQHMRWDEMRLLVIGFPESNRSLIGQPYIFRLYSAQGTVISWRCPGPTPLSSSDDFKPYRMTNEEARRRALALLNVIYARTGLRPRTLDPRLAQRANTMPVAAPATPQAQPATPQPGQTPASLAAPTAIASIPAPTTPARSRHAIALRDAWITLAVTLAVALVAILALFALSTSALLSPRLVMLVAALALVGYLLFLIAEARDLSRVRKIRSEWTGYPQANAQPDQVYTFTTGRHRSTRLLCLLGGLLLLPTIIPLAQIVFGVSATGAAMDASTSDTVAGVFAALNVLCGPIGILIALSGRRALFRADAAGISLIEGRHVSTIRWDEVERIERYVPFKEIALDAQGGIYTVFGHGAIAQIIWSVGGIAGAWLYGSLPNAEALTGDGMAALAVRRSGKPLEIAYKQDA